MLSNESDIAGDEKVLAALGLTYESNMRLAIRDWADTEEEMASRVGATLSTMESSAFELIEQNVRKIHEDGVDAYLAQLGDIEPGNGSEVLSAQKIRVAHERALREQWDDPSSDFWRGIRNKMLTVLKLSNEGKDRTGFATKMMFFDAAHRKIFKRLFVSTIVEESKKVLPYDEQEPKPAEVKIVAIEESVKEALGKEVAKAVKNKGGRPRKAERAADTMTQKEVAIMFNTACGGDVCNESMVSNWESFARTEGRRGATPPEGVYGGRAVAYTADLRKHPTPENKAILAAIIERFRSTRAVKDGIKNAQTTHYKSEESLHRMRGGTQAELARNRQNL